MSSHAAKRLALPALAAFLVATSQPAAAHVMATASIEVSAVVVASCQVSTGRGLVTAANTMVSCNGTTPGLVGGALASELDNPTDEEAAASAGTRAVVITY